jgi:hypothetical protein
MTTNWVKCTDMKGGEVYINLGAALTMRRISALLGDQTSIHFVLGTDPNDSISVQETPDQILKS